MATREEIKAAFHRIMDDLTLVADYIELDTMPEPPKPEPPTPDPTRPTALVRVIVDDCFLRELDHLNLSNAAVWCNYPKRSDNPHRDRFYAFWDEDIQVYIDGNIRWGKFKGAQRGDGGNHGWKVCEGQYFRNKAGAFVHLATGHPDLYILCRDVEKL